MFDQRVEQPRGAEPERVVCDEARLGLGSSDRRPSAAIVEVSRVECDTRDRRPPTGQRDPLVQLHELGQGE